MTKTANVYRVESKAGVGVYSLGLGMRCCKSAFFKRYPQSYQNNINYHPDPLLDINFRNFIGAESHNNQTSKDYNQSKDYYFGFESLNSLIDWFPLYSLALLSPAEQGELYCSKYSANTTDIVFGVRQLLFKQQQATLITQTSLERLLQSQNNHFMFDFSKTF